jgi:uncharacterized protein (DUF885 family)
MIPVLVVLAAHAGCGAPVRHATESTRPDRARDGRQRFVEFSGDFLQWYFAAHPVRATGLGIHDHDSDLPDMSRAGIELRSSEARDWLKKLEGIDRADLDLDASFDHRILDHAIRAELLDLEEIQSWKHNPMIYNRAIADGIASLVERDFASLDRRLEHLMERLDALPGVIDAARQNLNGVPKIWAELAARSARGTVLFLDGEVSAALVEQGLDDLDPLLRQRWSHSHARAVSRLERFAAWLQLELCPVADGDFRLGRDLFERKLLYEEHVSLAADELQGMNEAAILAYQEWVAREAARVDPTRAPAEIMAEVTNDYPSPQELISTARRFVEEAHRFVEDRGIVTLPTRDMPIIRPTPEFARSGFASMSTPGPFETRATEAYYNITNVDPSWSRRQQSEHLTYFNYAGLMGISVHEVMPGHYVHLLWRQRLPTDVRKVFLPASVVEGWAHYSEQMMIDEGLGDGDPSVRLGQLRRALQRHARWHVGLGMHAFDEPLGDAAVRFQEIAYFAEFPALRETQRGTYNPTYLYYALGRMEILRLREDYRAYLESRGREFSLREFHDRFLSLGLPISLAREAMMPDAAHSSHSGSGSTPKPSASRS